MDFTPFPLLLKSPLYKALLARNFGCSLSAKLSIMSTAILYHCPSTLLLTWVPYTFFYDPSHGNDQCPRVNLRAYCVILCAFAMQFSLLRRFHQSISLYIDMKMILPLKCSGSHFDSLVMIFWISSQFCESREICKRKKFHLFPIDSLILSILKLASNKMISASVELCETEICFLHIQLIAQTCDFRIIQCSTWSRFRVLNISCKIGVLKQSQSALLGSVSHMTILLITTCMMNVRNQSIQAFVTGHGPFGDRSCKFVHWPKNIRSSNTCQIHAF